MARLARPASFAYCLSRPWSLIPWTAAPGGSRLRGVFSVPTTERRVQPGRVFVGVRTVRPETTPAARESATAKRLRMLRLKMKRPHRPNGAGFH